MTSRRGRRLVDGAFVETESRVSTYLLVGVVLLVLALTCPSHDSFIEHLTVLSKHPSGLLNTLSSLASAFHATIAAKSETYIFWRFGTYRNERYLGLLGTWVRLGGIGSAIANGSRTSVPSMRSATSWICASQFSPCELVVLLSLLLFILWRTYPRAMARHTICSLRAVQEGRVWVLLSSAVSHASFLHLLHNCLHLLEVGPIAQAALGCDDLLALMLGAALASSLTSIVWHSVLGNCPSEGSIGASGVVMALVAANAALFPRTHVLIYGLQLLAPHAVLFYLFLDVLTQSRSGGGGGGGIDVSSHAGGALFGWLFVKRWRRLAFGGLSGFAF
jgi:membrane associated rhomboid family serine protease